MKATYTLLDRGKAMLISATTLRGTLAEGKSIRKASISDEIRDNLNTSQKKNALPNLLACLIF